MSTRDILDLLRERLAGGSATDSDGQDVEIADLLTWAIDDIEKLRQWTAEAEERAKIARAERDEAQIGKRRAEAATLPALFLLLGDAQEMSISSDEYAAIFDTCLAAEDPTPIPLPASCLVDGKPDPTRLFRLAEELRREYRGQPVTFYLRAAREATPTAEAVEAAIMCRRVQG